MDFQTRYEFDPKTDLLGKGGFSKVYKANDILLERTVALKFFTAKTADKYQILNEIKRVIRFEHPNLCKYYDVALLNYKNVLDETEQMEVGIMEYIDSGDFKSYIRKHPQYTDKLLIDVLKGLAYLHKHGMAHRDLKPQNILIKMVDDEPVSKITDFGISKLVDTDDANSSALLGTIEYMAPEQFNPKKYGVNGRIATNLDLWSFGLLVYEAVCHQSLFGSRSTGISAEQVMANILSDAPLEKAETLPPQYKEIIERCLVKNAAERTQNALELIPLFGDGSAPLVPASVSQPTDSGRIVVAETEVLNLPPTEPEPEPEPEPETQFVHRLEQDEPEETEAFPNPVFDLHDAIKRDDVDPLPTAPDFTTGDTQVLQPVGDFSEVTQPIETVSPATAVRAEAIDVTPDAVEQPTQVITKTPAKPIVKEVPAKSNGETEWKPINWNKPARKPVGKIVLLAVAAVLLLAFFVAYPLLNKPQADPKPPVADVKTTIPKPKPAGPIFRPPTTLPVAGGTFSMGDAGNAGTPVHQVTVSGFEMGETEITVDQFRQFVNATGYKTTAEEEGSSHVFNKGEWSLTPGKNWRHDGAGNLVDSTNKKLPVVHVSWKDAVAYCNWLSDTTKTQYRLPTEAEWEYAARGGTASKNDRFSGSNNIDEAGWYSGNSANRLHEVRTKQANELKLYDMSGNAMEWCKDVFAKNYYSRSASTDPVNTEAGDKRVTRGGGWGTTEQYCQTAERLGYPYETRGGNLGFRIVKSTINHQ